VIDADDDRLAQLERRGRLIGLVIVELVVGLSVAGVVLVMLNKPPTLYESASRVRHHGIAAVVVLTAVFVAVLWRAGMARALLVVGGLTLAAALIVGTLPPGGGWARCRSVLGDFWGRRGDEDESCFDLRQVQKVDVASTAGAGLVLLGAGVALAAGPPPAT
jgi:hypothetical protein